jgi:hypothetical protein
MSTPTCISFPEILNISRPQIEEFQSLSTKFPDPMAEEACEAFSRQVIQVEGVLRNCYGVASVLARKSDDLKEVVEIWKSVSQLCHQAIQVLSSEETLPDAHDAAGQTRTNNMAY